MRLDGRTANSTRQVSFQRNFTRYAPGSVLVSFGHTKVLCSVTIEEKVPPFMRDSGKGWLTAEYALLPASTHTRSSRESAKGKLSGRTHEIQRLIGRSLRSIVDLDKVGERTFYIDADVIQADGGTRTAAITGSMLALWDAVQSLVSAGKLAENPIQELLAAVSVGICDGQIVCDLDYEEDSTAQVDMNVVMTESGKIVEVQGTAEENPFTQDELLQMLAVAKQGIFQLIGSLKAQING